MEKYKNYKKKEYSVLKAITRAVVSLFLCLVLCVMGLMFYCNNFLEYYPIQGESMRPLLNQYQDIGDYVYITKTTDVTYQNVIIYKRPDNLVIKRVIAMQNDNIKLKKDDDGLYAIYIQYNSTGEWQKLNEEYISDKSVYESTYNKFYNSLSPGEFQIDDDGDEYYHVDEGEIFYAGDNRENSGDCFNYGSVKTENIVGKVVYIIHSGQLRIWQVMMQFLGIYRWK